MLTRHSKCTSQVQGQEEGRRGCITQCCSMCPYFVLTLCTVDFFYHPLKQLHGIKRCGEHDYSKLTMVVWAAVQFYAHYFWPPTRYILTWLDNNMQTCQIVIHHTSEVS